MKRRRPVRALPGHESALALALTLASLGLGCAAAPRTSEEVMDPRPLPVPAESEPDHLWGYRDALGAWEIPPRFQVAHPFTTGGIAAVADETGWRYVDRRGATVVARPWIVDNTPDAFSEGLARCLEEDGVAFFDEAGRVVLRTGRSYAEPFSEGLAAVCDGCRAEPIGEHARYVGGRWGYLDRSGRLVVPCRYDEAASFEGGEARVRQGRAWLSIDRSGRPLPVL